MAYDNNAPQNAVPTNSAEPVNPVLAASAAALQMQNQAVQQAARTVQNTAQVLNTSGGQPAPPTPKTSILGQASPNNVANEHPVTREGARNKAIGQIAGQAGALVNSFIQKKQNEKTQALAIDIHRSLELQQGMDEAKQVLANDPNNVQAKAALQKNQTLMTALLNGKNGKEIGKAYGVTFGPEAQTMSPEDKGKSMHHQAMQLALKQGKQDQQQAQSMAKPPQLPPPAQPNVQRNNNFQEFESQLPARIRENPAYQAAKDNYAAVAKQAQEATRNYLDFAGKVMTSQATTKAADTRAAAEKYAADQRKETELLKEKNEAAQKAEEEKVKFSHEMAEIGARGAESRKTVSILVGHKDNDNVFKANQDSFVQASTDVRKYSDQIAGLYKAMQAAKAKDSDADTSKMEKQITDLKSSLAGAQNQASQSYGSMVGNKDAANMMQILSGLDNK